MLSFATTATISRSRMIARRSVSSFHRESGTRPPAKRVVVVLRTEGCD